MSDHTTFDQSPEDPKDAFRRAQEQAILKHLAEVVNQRKEPLRDPEALAERMERVEIGADPRKDLNPNIREHVLKTANKLVNGDRNAQYGDPNQDFKRTADYFGIYIQSVIEREGHLTLFPHDIAVLQVLLKISRLAVSPNKEDHWVDIAGYAACGAHCAQSEYGGLV